MNRNQFLRKLKRYCKESDRSFEWKPGEGRGGHGTVYVDDRKTILKTGELPNDYVSAVLKQLGLGKGAI